MAGHPRRGLVVLGLLVLSLAVGALALPALGDMRDQGVGIVEFELARTAERASELYGQLGEDGRDAARRSLYLDFPYLVAYALFFAAWVAVVAARAAERGRRRLGELGAALAFAPFAAAACDCVENVALLYVLDGHTDQPAPGIAFAFAPVKFALLAAAALYALAAFAVTLRRPPAPRPA